MSELTSFSGEVPISEHHLNQEHLQLIEQLSVLTLLLGWSSTQVDHIFVMFAEEPEVSGVMIRFLLMEKIKTFLTAYEDLKESTQGFSQEYGRSRMPKLHPSYVTASGTIHYGGVIYPRHDRPEQRIVLPPEPPVQPPFPREEIRRRYNERRKARK